MNDNNKDDEHHDEFEEEFEFEGEIENEPLAPEEHEEEDHEEEDHEEEEHEEEGSVVQPTARKGIMLPIIICAVIASFMGWKIYRMIVPSQPHTEEANETTQTQTIEKTKPSTTQTKVTHAQPLPAPLPTPAGTPTTTLPAWEETQKAAKANLPEETIGTLQKKLEDQENAHKLHIQALQRELDNSVQNAANANQSTNALAQEVARLSSALLALRADVQALQEEQLKQKNSRLPVKKNKSAAARRERADTANPSLTVYAIIPGRVWLRSQNGKTITVVEGDQAGEYGTVLKIDAGNGVVITSSGATLR